LEIEGWVLPAGLDPNNRSRLSVIALMGDAGQG